MINLNTLKRHIVLPVLSVLIAISGTTQVLAFDEGFYSGNNILFSDPTTCSPNADTSITGPTTSGTYTNSVYEKTQVPDPSVVRGEDGKWHAYASGFQHFESPDGTTWEKVQRSIFSNSSNVDANYPSWVSGDHWAPDISKTGDHYTLVLSGNSPKRIGYAVSDKAGGPFKDMGVLIDSSGESSGYVIDPNLVHISGDNYILYYGSSHKGITAQKLKLEGEKLVKQGNKKVVMDGNPSVWTTEAASVIKNGEYYYLFYSEGKYTIREDYNVRVARSKDPFGTFQKQSGEVLKGNSKFVGPGGGTAFLDSAGQEWFIYHARKPSGSMDRYLMLDKINFENGWPTISNGSPSTEKQTGPASGAAITPGSNVSGTNANIEVTLAQMNVQSPSFGYAKSQRQRVQESMQKFSGENPDFFTLNEIAPDTDTKIDKYDSFKKNYPGAKTNEDSAIRILWDTTRWKKLAGDVKLIHEYEGSGANVKDRYALWATFQNISTGGIVSVIGTHWTTRATFPPNHGRSKIQADNVKALAQELLPNGAVVIGGDFNYQLNEAEQPYSPATALGELNIKAAFKNGEGTYVDWIFYSDQLKVDNKRAIDSGNDLSDHPYIVAKMSGSSGSTYNGQSVTSACFCEDPNASTDTTGVDVNLTGSDNAEKIYNFLTTTEIGKNDDSPMSPIQASAMIGNFYQESKLDPTIVNSIGATGIAQWLGGRKDALMKLPNPTTLETQLKFVVQELNGSEGAILSHPDFKDATDIDKATTAVRRTYERPGESEANDPARIAAAKKVYEKFSGNGLTTATSTSDVSSSTTSTGGCASEKASESDQDIGVGQGDFTDGGEIANWSTVKANALLVNKVQGDSMEWKGWCAGIVARTWMGKNSGFNYSPHYTMTLVKDHPNLVHSGQDKGKPKKGSILLLSSSSQPLYGHVVIYLGDNKVLNDGVIRDAAEILKNREYYGWTDPNDLSWSKPVILSEEGARAMSTVEWAAI